MENNCTFEELKHTTSGDEKDKMISRLFLNKISIIRGISIFTQVIG